jgi:DNA polymerase-3 subunit epsilon
MLPGSMDRPLRELEVLAIDCQASGATPAYGDLIELGWAVCGASGSELTVRSHWVVPRTQRPISRPIRELTGWREACLSEALDETAVWDALRVDMGRLAERWPGEGVATVIHYARFELTFLRDLHARLCGDEAAFPFDAVCVHAIAARFFPDLPRRNIRALAGFLGHSPELMRRSAGHVEATAFIWRALVPRLEQAGVTTWSALKAWLEQPVASPRRTTRRFPLAPERRRALPARPGVYRFLRSNGDVLYVGKATSLKARVAGHFKSRGPTTERALELLSQVHDIATTETATLLEAALLETDEIKRLDPPYNVQLRTGERRAWFCARDFTEACGQPDDRHPIGPLPWERALTPWSALLALCSGAEATPRLRAMALAVPVGLLPEDALFATGFDGFLSEHLALRGEPSVARRLEGASRALWIARGRSETEPASEDAAPDTWDLARVRRRLERALVQCGLLLRRARFLTLLADSTVAFHEREAPSPRALAIAGGEIVRCFDLPDVLAIATHPRRVPSPRRVRQQAFDAGAYDRLRVLLTEMRRVQLEGGEVALQLGAHTFGPTRLATLMRPL